MFARSLGPAQSPGRSVYERELQRSNQQQSHPIDGDSSESSLLNSIRSIFPSFNSSSKRFPAFNSVVTPLPQTAGPRNPFAKPEVQIDEELAWFGSKLIWSRGSTIYRTFSYEQEKQKVTRALFAQFALEAALPDAHNSIIEDDDHPSGSGDFPTFGPYHTSQHAKWGKPEKKVDGTRRSPHSEQLKRCLVVVLEDWAHVYYPTGHDLVVTIPFPLAGAWALPSGGLMVQRERNSKETKRVNSRETQPHGPLKAQNGMSLDQTMETVLTELEADRMEGVLNKGISDEARLYSLRHPSSELQVVVETPLLQVGRTDTHGKTDRIERPTNVKPLGLETDVLWVSDEKSTPLAVGRDCMTNEIVFSRWACLPLVSSAEPEMSETKDVAEQEYASSVRNKSIPLSGSSKSKRMSLARQDSVNGTQLERRASIAARRSTGPVPNRRVSFHPEIPKAGKERMYPGVVPGADVDESVSARIKAEADLVRGMPHQRRTSHGMKENERFNGNYDIDFEVGETTMLHGIEANEDTIGFDVVLEEFGRWRIPTSRYVLSKIAPLRSSY
jgi:anaphase-promoting complex subunit 1